MSAARVSSFGLLSAAGPILDSTSRDAHHIKLFSCLHGFAKGKAGQE